MWYGQVPHPWCGIEEMRVDISAVEVPPKKWSQSQIRILNQCHQCQEKDSLQHLAVINSRDCVPEKQRAAGDQGAPGLKQTTHTQAHLLTKSLLKGPVQGLQREKCQGHMRRN